MTSLRPRVKNDFYPTSDRLSNLIIFSPRPKFRKDTKGVDSVTVAWFVWQHRHQGGTQIELCNNWKQGGAR